MEEATLQMKDLVDEKNYEYNLSHKKPNYVKCTLRRRLTEWLVTINEGDMKGTRWVINENTISRLREIKQ